MSWRLLGALLIASVGCYGGGEFEPGPTARVERRVIERIVVATGTIEPEREVEVRSRLAGIIETIHVDEGDIVEADQPLLDIERDLLESQVREARAALDAARVELRFAKIALDRSDELSRGGAASQQKRDDARNRYESGRAGVARDLLRRVRARARDGESAVSREYQEQLLAAHDKMVDRLVNVEGAAHWVHHDRLEVFLEELATFLSEPG